MVPHITDAIQEWIARVAQVPVDGLEGPSDVCIIELGGTVGDIESMPFLEALRQFQFRVGSDNFCLVHVSLVPVLGVVGEQKTKPTQHSVRELRALGLTPHLLACRSADVSNHRWQHRGEKGRKWGIRSGRLSFVVCFTSPWSMPQRRSCHSSATCRYVLLPPRRLE